MYSLAFIMALLAFGGLAAYLGDVLGYRLGKRRLSLLRLRPRTTARLVGVLVGMMIPAVTVAISSLLVPEVRDAVFRIDDLHREIGLLQSERDTAAQQRESFRAQASKERKAAAMARRDAEASRADLASVRTALGRARASLDEARRRMAELRAQTQRLGRERDAAVKDRDNTRRDLREAETALKNAEAALKDAERGLEEVKQRLAEAEEENNVVQSERDRLQAERETLVGQTQTLRRDVATLREELVRLQREWELQHTIFALRRPILEIDTELVRGVIRRPPTVDALTDEIVKLLFLADTVAQAAGAAANEKGRFTRAIFPLDLSREWNRDDLPPEEMVVGVVRRQLWASPADEHVVQIKVAARAFAGEVVQVRFEARPNELVFAKGETIVVKEWPAGLNEADALERLWLLIADPDHSEVRRQARAGDLLPNPKTGGYGEITIRELHAAAKACANRTTPVTVRVQAAADAYTVGPLKIRIVVEPPSDQQG